ncbi:MAG: hypothetical protein BGO43_14000 [Gammaproteobacteria bacterium 39-13]|nr:hypothetical protein [Gammaproteobacteria bacterium]OJV85797.1 MAG: hypothetical protein BGO43_14000 [Gammaproteobacteria bacterium 39-13]
MDIMEQHKEKLEEVLYHFLTAFRHTDSDNPWYKALGKIYNYSKNNYYDIVEIAEIIRRWYGGMGSFNDVPLGDTRRNATMGQTQR